MVTDTYRVVLVIVRYAATAGGAAAGSEKQPVEKESPDETAEMDEQQRQGWLSRMLTVRKIDPGRGSHSRQLADKDTVYELQSKYMNM